ncbi:hypothetical protein CXB51_028344 [Gossypium anomalum]|uniref:Aminotransferase-like plant mobile domain-containing protein n=1 Tax=Gossypium anomalum TaxID=47600 RepID=A0A8J5XXZ8_9ROSI|nr:hypothetical protein CXB51_028344 [Gossypium anomalum]
MTTLDGYRVLRSRFHFLKYDPDEWTMPYLWLAGFGDVALIRRFDMRANLISALVERWCTKTHTFIMSCGECTITLEDVAMQLGLRVDDAMELSSIATEHKVMCAARAYIMQLIVERTYAKQHINKVHLKYLPLLEDFSRIGGCSWGWAMLAVLYYELCRAAKHGKGHVSGNWCEPNINHLLPNDRGFLWMLYSALNIATLIPQWVHAEAYMRCINMSVLNFSTIEWYNCDRVMRQFRRRQLVPVEPQKFVDVHSKTMRGKHTTDWSVEHQCYVALWNARAVYITRTLAVQVHITRTWAVRVHITRTWAVRVHITLTWAATFDPTADLPDVYSTPQRLPYQ